MYIDGRSKEANEVTICRSHVVGVESHQGCSTRVRYLKRIHTNLRRVSHPQGVHYS